MKTLNSTITLAIITLIFFIIYAFCFVSAILLQDPFITLYAVATSIAITMIYCEVFRIIYGEMRSKGD